MEQIQLELGEVCVCVGGCSWIHFPQSSSLHNSANPCVSRQDMVPPRMELSSQGRERAGPLFFCVSTSLLSPLKSIFPFNKDSLPIFSSWSTCQKEPLEEVLQSTSERVVQPTAGEPRSGIPLADGSCCQNSYEGPCRCHYL